MFDPTKLKMVPSAMLAGIDPSMLEVLLNATGPTPPQSGGGFAGMLAQTPPSAAPMPRGFEEWLGNPTPTLPMATLPIPPNAGSQAPAPIEDKSVQAVPPTTPQLKPEQMQALMKMFGGEGGGGQRQMSPGSPASGRAIGNMTRVGGGVGGGITAPLTLAQLLMGRR